MRSMSTATPESVEDGCAVVAVVFGVVVADGAVYEVEAGGEPTQQLRCAVEADGGDTMRDVADDGVEESRERVKAVVGSVAIVGVPTCELDGAAPASMTTTSASGSPSVSGSRESFCGMPSSVRKKSLALSV